MANEPPGLSSRLAAIVVALACLLPLAYGLIHIQQQPWTGSTVGPRLHGYTDPTPTPAYDWWNRSLQKTVEVFINQRTPLRNWLIKVNSQLDYSLLRTNRFNRNNYRIGRGGMLYEAPYLFETFGYIARMPDARIRDLGMRIKRLQLRLAERGISFVVLGTPGKPSLTRDAAPIEFPPYKPEIPRSYDRMVTIFGEIGVTLYDGLATMLHSPLRKRGPLFPVGGTHWTELGVLAASQPLIETELRKATGEPNPRMVLDEVINTVPAREPDTDILELLNLLWPDRSFGSTSIRVHLDGKPFPKGIGLIGTSFIGGMVDVFRKAKVAPLIYNMPYMRGLVPCVDCMGKPLSPDWTEFVLRNTSLVILEVNEAVYFGDPTFSPNFGDKFVDEMLAALEPPKS